MELFYIICISIAAVLLILILTYLGMVIGSSAKNSVSIPTKQSPCPDYWVLSENGSCKWNGTNLGDNNFWKDAPGYDSNTNSIDFTAPGWANFGGISSSTLCGLKNWCNKHNLEWDSVTNSNSC